VNSFRYPGVTSALCMALMMTLLWGCAAPPGKPRKGSEILAPNEIVRFDALYAENCSACHGADGRGGAAIALADPLYLSIVDEPTMRKVIANGVHGTSMPAFAHVAGGMLTDKQVDVISRGIRSRWSQQEILDGADPPPYFAESVGKVQRGKVVYETFCRSCHGPEGEGGPKGSSITNKSYLALVSDQGLRTVVIVGRPELGAPDWRENIPGKPMSDQQITDVVAWLASHRGQNSEQPDLSSNYDPH
jgi:cytochrome c oxidase cbb3-type subunit III